MFRNVKTIEEQLSYEARHQKHLWINKDENLMHNLEYYETLKITSYCSFEFSNFPFDGHKCELIFGSGGGGVADKEMKLSRPTIIYNQTKSKENAIPIFSTNVPFLIKAESIEPLTYHMNGHNYSYAGIRLSLKRNNLGLLFGSFYGPTAIFSILSIFSYNINVDMVFNSLILSNYF